MASTSASDSSTSPVLLGESIWTSTTDGRDYKVRINGDSIHAEWVNLPQALKKSSAFLRSELKKNGDKWIGQTTAYMPFDYQHDATKTIWCRVQADIEINTVSASRIEGQSQLPTSFSAKKCQPENAEWKPFAWIPKSK
jgi:phage terminase large subunit-like protein